MDRLELCKLSVESLILTVAERYIPQIDLVSTVPGIQNFSVIEIISKIGVDISVLPTSKHLCLWACLTTQNYESAGKKMLLASVMQETTSSLYLFNVLFVLSVKRAISKSAIGSYLLKSAEVTRKPSLLLRVCY